MSRVIVIGGGISGLSAAYYLQKAGAEVTLVEKEPRLGGLLETRTVDGCLIEAGPDSFLAAKPAALELIRELGLESEVISSNDHQRRTYIWRGGRLMPMPDGLILMAPTDFQALAMSPLISARSRFDAAKEVLRARPAEPPAERSVAEFVRDHYGQEFVDYLAEPLLTGVFGGDAEILSVNEVIPRFVELESRYGSVTRGLVAERKPNDGESLFKSLRGGLQQLVDALEQALAGIRRIHGKAEAVEPGVRIRANGEWLDADHAIIALRTWQAAPLIEDLDPELARLLRSIRYSSAVTVGFTYSADEFPHPLDGFGFLVPKIERRNIVACTWVNRKFDHRAAPNRVILRAFLGGEHWAEKATDDEIVAVVREDLALMMGVHKEPIGISIARWPQSMPLYELGHRAKMADIRGRLMQVPSLHLIGNADDGIGIPDCIRHARAVLC